MDNCIFCMIAKHEIPAKILYEDDKCMAFLDLSQATDGHTLIIPKQHFSHFVDVDINVLKHMSGVAQDLAKQIIERTNAKGMNIISNMNEVAGQNVHHFHIHLIPRYSEDEGLKIIYTDRSNDVDLESIYIKLKKQ